MKKNFYKSGLLLVALFFSASVWAQDSATIQDPTVVQDSAVDQDPATVQDVGKAVVETESNRPRGGQLGFNLFMSLISNSERNELMYRGLSEEAGLLNNGLGMSFRMYFTQRLAARGGLSFFNYRERQDALASMQGEISGISAWQGKLGLMLATKGTDKLEPYFFSDVVFGESRMRYKPRLGEMEHTDLLSSFGLVSGIGFNYYFAKNISVGAEMGIGLIGHDPVQVNERIRSFYSGANGNLGVTVFF